MSPQQRDQGGRFYDLGVAALLALLVLVSYGLFAPSLGFYWDDWTRIGLAAAYGTEEVRDLAMAERPWLDFWVAGSIDLLGYRPAAWHVANTAVRILGALAAYGLVRSLYGRALAAPAAILFVLLPAFTFHSIAATFLLAASFNNLAFLASLYLMVLCVRSGKTWRRLLLMIGSLAGLAVHLTICEYYYGAELARPLVLWLCLAPAWPHRAARLKHTLIWWSPYLAVFAAAIFQRLFLFGPAGGHGPAWPTAAVLARRVLFAARSLYGLFLSSWLPRADVLFDASDRPVLVLTVLLAAGAGGIVYLALARNRAASPPPRTPGGRGAPALHGLAFAILSLLPIWAAAPVPLAGAKLKSLYAMVPGIGVTLAVSALIIRCLPGRRGAHVVLACLAALGLAVQFQTTADFAAHWRRQRDLWDQLRLRCPHIQAGTTLLIAAPEFPGYAVKPQELTHPANLAYHTDSDRLNLMAYPLSSQSWIWPNDTQPEVLLQPGKTRRAWGREFLANGQALVCYYDKASGVLYIPDKALPILPASVPFFVRFWAERSQTGLIGKQRLADDLIADLGIWTARPAGWAECFQRIQLLRQFGDWQGVADIVEKAAAGGLAPTWPVDYLPVLDAYLHLGRQRQAVDLAGRIAQAGPYEASLLGRLLKLRKADIPLAAELASQFAKKGPVSLRGRTGKEKD